MKKLLLFLALLLSPIFAPSLTWAQSASTYYTLPSITALKALMTRPSVVEVVDSNPGVFNWSTTPCSAADDIFQVTPTSGPTGCYTRMGTPYATGKNGPPANVKTFGAVCDTAGGTTGSATTTAFRNAVATGNPVYVPSCTGGNGYILTDMVTLNNAQVLYGDGPTTSLIFIPSSFNLSAAGVFKAASSETGATISNIGITFTQPDVTTPGGMTQYPPAIYARNVPGFRANNVRLSRCMTGIDMRGNSGHSFLQNIEGSCFTNLITIDGPQDAVWLNNVNGYPYALSANQMTAMLSAYVVDVGRLDSGFFNNIQGVGYGRTLNLRVGSDGASVPNLTVGNTYVDSAGGITMTAGLVNIGEIQVGLGSLPEFAINQTGGRLSVGAIGGVINHALTNPIINLQSTATGSASSTSGTTLTVGGTVSGIFEVGQYVGGTGVAANTTITGNCYTNPGTYTGCGGSGTYGISISQTLSSGTLTGTATSTPAGTVTTVAPMATQISGINVKMNSHDNWLVDLDGGGGQSLVLTNVSVERDSNVVYSKPTLLLNTGYATVAGLFTTALGTGTGTLVSSGASAQVQLSGVVPGGNGWTITLPSGAAAQTFNGPVDATAYRISGAAAATTVNGTSCALGASCTATAAAGTLTGSTLAAGVTGSSLTGVGTLTSGSTGAGFTVGLSTSTLTGTLPSARLGAQSIGANGYQALGSSGTIEQWGSGTTSGGTTASVSFPVAFGTAVDSITVTGSTSGTGCFFTVGGVTTSGFTANTFSPCGAGSSFFWSAKGR